MKQYVPLILDSNPRLSRLRLQLGIDIHEKGILNRIPLNL
jgi:hypothetical protein